MNTPYESQSNQSFEGTEMIGEKENVVNSNDVLANFKGKCDIFVSVVGFYTSNRELNLHNIIFDAIFNNYPFEQIESAKI